MANNLAQLTLGREKSMCVTCMDSDGDEIAFRPWFCFLQLLNQVYSHFKQIQFELQIKNVNVKTTFV